MLSENTRPEPELSQLEQFFKLFIKKYIYRTETKKCPFVVRKAMSKLVDMRGEKTLDTENFRDCQ